MRKGFVGAAVAGAILALPAAAGATHSNGAGPKQDIVQGSGRGTIAAFGTIVDDQGHINANSDGVETDGMYWIEFAGVLLRGRVVCLSSDGNEARWSGPIERSNSPFFPAGNWVVAIDVDNGEGASAPPDEHGGIVRQPPPPGECPEDDMPTRPLTQGNLIVHDGV